MAQVDTVDGFQATFGCMLMTLTKGSIGLHDDEEKEDEDDNMMMTFLLVLTCWANASIT